MGLPLLAKVGEERELTEEISIYDILDILDFAELGKDVADLTTEYLKGGIFGVCQDYCKGFQCCGWNLHCCLRTGSNSHWSPEKWQDRT